MYQNTKNVFCNWLLSCPAASEKNMFFNRWGETIESAVPALKPHSLFLSAFQNLQVVQINLETERMNSSRGNILLLCPKLLAHMNSILLHFGSNHAVVFPRVKLRRSRTRCPRERIQAEAFFFSLANYWLIWSPFFCIFELNKLFSFDVSKAANVCAESLFLEISSTRKLPAMAHEASSPPPSNLRTVLPTNFYVHIEYISAIPKCLGDIVHDTQWGNQRV